MHGTCRLTNENSATLAENDACVVESNVGKGNFHVKVRLCLEITRTARRSGAESLARDEGSRVRRYSPRKATNRFAFFRIHLPTVMGGTVVIARLARFFENDISSEQAVRDAAAR